MLALLLVMMMHGVLVECIFAEDCCEMMGCVVMASWLVCVLVLVLCLVDFGGYLRTFTAKWSVPLSTYVLIPSTKKTLQQYLLLR